ncbi:MAG: AmmeMemoRadiSam system radical SAM enzyme [Thaumarchaeota archaeon]|nr:AmmeMemoRadiSam system radical SAM enzyme [Nitrososphaerota archaeon]
MSQSKLYEMLDELGVGYEKEFKIHVEKGVEDSKAYYFADAAFPETRLDIEVDGWWHYNNEDVKRSDRVRDETLKTNGWEVLRISGSYLFNHPEEVKALIAQRIVRPIMVNKRTWVVANRVRPTDRIEQVYSIETLPNHNYVADGMIVHNCNYCQNHDISQRRKVEGVDASPADVAGMAESRGCEGMAYTYNQPTIFMEYARDIGRVAREKGIFNIFVSNGFDTPETVGMMKDFLDCMTVDFKGSGETGFVRRYIGIPSAEPIYQTLLETKRKTNVHIEITDLIVPEVGDNLDVARSLSRWVYDNLGPDTPIHFLRFHPDYKMMDLPWTPVQTLEKHYDVARKEGLRYVYIGNVPGHPKESTYCPECGRVLIGRYGYDILEYNLDKNSNCKFCGCRTPIVGPLSKSWRDDRFIPVVN